MPSGGIRLPHANPNTMDDCTCKGRVGPRHASGLMLQRRRGRKSPSRLGMVVSSPELNLIEILWRFIKYHWLPFSAYMSFPCLVQAVEDILTRFGTDFTINFQAKRV